MKHLKPFLRLFFEQHRKPLLLGSLMAVLTLLAGMALMSLSGWFLASTAIAGLVVPAALINVFIPSALIRLFAVGKTAARYAERVLTHDATLRVLATLRERLFLGWASPHAAGQLLAHPSRLLFRLTLDIDALDALYLRVLVPWLCAALAISVAAFVMVWFSVPLALVFIGSCLLMAALTHWLLWRASEHAQQQRVEGLEAYRTGVIDALSGQTDLLMTQQLGQRVQDLHALESSMAHADARLQAADAKASFAQQAFNTLLLACTITLCAWAVQQDHFSTTIACALILLVFASFEAFPPLHRATQEWIRVNLAAHRLAARLDTTYQMGQADSTTQIKAESVSIHYPHSQQAVLESLSFSIEAGEHIALIGSSGAGKSSLLALLARELAPSSGFFQAPLASILTQRTEVFRDTIRENLLIAHPLASDEQLFEALGHAGLTQVIASLPQGLDTLLGEGGLGLSGGQARRLSLARLFLQPTQFWLLDEPTEGLDASTSNDIMHRLVMNAQHRTLIIATHSQCEACHADRLFRLEDRRLVECVDRSHPRFNELLTSLRTD